MAFAGDGAVSTRLRSRTRRDRAVPRRRDYQQRHSPAPRCPRSEGGSKVASCALATLNSGKSPTRRARPQSRARRGRSLAAEAESAAECPHRVAAAKRSDQTRSDSNLALARVVGSRAPASPRDQLAVDLAPPVDRGEDEPPRSNRAPPRRCHQTRAPDRRVRHPAARSSGTFAHSIERDPVAKS